MNNIKFDCNFSMNDLFCNMLLGFVCLFMFAMIMIAKDEQKKAGDVPVHAEFIITVTWPAESPDDVDTYVEDPIGNIVCFNRREQGLMHLDRDDLGHKNDEVLTPDGVVTYDENREVVTIRGYLPGEYIVNVHMYHREVEYDKPLTVTIRCDKINPFSQVAVQTVVLRERGDERTAFRFYVNKDGTIKNVNRLPKRFMNQSSPQD